MKKLISKAFGITVVKPMGAMTCEAVYCSGSGTYSTLYEVVNSKLVKRGCC